MGNAKAQKETVEFNPDDPVFVSRYTAVIRNVLDRFLHESGDPIGSAYAAMCVAAAEGSGFAGSLETTMTDQDGQSTKMRLAEDDNWFKFEVVACLRFPLHVAVVDEDGQRLEADVEFDGGEMDVTNVRWSCGAKGDPL